MEALNRALVAELAQCRPRYFVRLAFKSGDVLLHTGVGERRFLGRTWFGLGMLIKTMRPVFVCLCTPKVMRFWVRWPKTTF
ncbi:hypothetical protein [Pseudoalteromonas luteoviolacea]|uniref:Uncharacterized protein n=1 Tax=Pseudoalteromonas luteoviolacea S4060-1 TaxID=1365257 RepID=A0A162CBZ1_9GAMM|nr:hypothetical protein [Pseudoalteromonas luteoviolacea]KZN65473.1 hypothetical protein N478_21295 [Pseudoalteromonas luteoviolacea S4060-1]